MKTLYKKDSKGKLRVWNIFTVDDKLVQESGLLNGKLKQDSSVCTPKNVGKANQTTGEEQAKLELESKYAAKLKEGYFTTQEEAMNSVVVLPMLAKEYGKEEHKIDWNEKVFAQPKLDGMRCFGIINGDDIQLISRKGTPIDTLPHIVDALKGLRIVTATPTIFDGELYAHGKTFQENMKLIKKYRPGESEEVRYHIYDMVADHPFEARYLTALELLREHLPQTILVPVPTGEIAKEAIPEVQSQNIQMGFEGTMIRWSKAGYQLDKRSSYLLKYKEFQDAACPIIDVVPSDARPEQGILVCTFNGNQFKAGMKGTHAQREELLTNKQEYIGQIAEIRYFEETDGGVPRFPVCHGLRLDK